jgi:hypothetical protein
MPSPFPLPSPRTLPWFGKEITDTSLCGSLSRSPSQACFRVRPPTTAQSPISDPSIHPSVLSIAIRFHRLALWTNLDDVFLGWKYNGMLKPPGSLCWVRCQASPFIHPFILSIALDFVNLLFGPIRWMPFILILWNGQAPLLIMLGKVPGELVLGWARRCTPHIMSKGKTIPWHYGLVWQIQWFKRKLN